MSMCPVRVRLCVCVSERGCMHARVCVCACVRVCVCVCVCVCVRACVSEKKGECLCARERMQIC